MTIAHPDDYDFHVKFFFEGFHWNLYVRVDGNDSHEQIRRLRLSPHIEIIEDRYTSNKGG